VPGRIDAPDGAGPGPNADRGVAAVLCYALTGWITGVAFALCFNFAAQKTGGIDAKFVSVAGDDSAAKQQLA